MYFVDKYLNIIYFIDKNKHRTVEGSIKYV